MPFLLSFCGFELMSLCPEILCFVHKSPSKIYLFWNLYLFVSFEKVKKGDLSFNICKLLAYAASWTHTESCQTSGIELFLFIQPSFRSKFIRIFIIFGVKMSCYWMKLNSCAFIYLNSIKQMIFNTDSGEINWQRTIIPNSLFLNGLNIL